MRAAASDLNLHDLGAAATAGQTLLLVDAPALLVSAGYAVAIEIVTHRGAATLDRIGEHTHDCITEMLGLYGLDATCRSQRVDGRVPKRFIDVDVPQASDAPLVEQERFDGRAPAGSGFKDLAGGEALLEWLWAALTHDLIWVGDKVPSAEFSDIAPTQLMAVVQKDCRPEVPVLGVVWVAEKPAACHSKVRDEGNALAELQDQPFSAPPYRPDAAATDGFNERLLVGMPDESWEGGAEPDIFNRTAR